MPLSREKKELWRYASEKWTATNGTTDQQQQPPRHPHPRPPQQQQQQQQLQLSSPQSAHTFGNSADFSMAQHDAGCLTLLHQAVGETTTETTLSASATVSEAREGFSKRGCSYASCGDDMTADETELSSESTSTSTSTSPSSCKSSKCSKPKKRRPTSRSFHRQVAKIFHNCCGVFSDSMSTSTSVGTRNNNNYSNNNGSSSSKRTYSSAEFLPSMQQQFDALMKQLKSSQSATLLKAVNCRRDGLPNKAASSVPRSHTQCILLPRAPILGEEPHLIVCRLFFWQGLRNASQLKPLPTCPNDGDTVCCNPMHWYKILETDTAPPPYRHPTMERLNSQDHTSDESSLNEGNASQTSTNTADSTLSTRDWRRDLRVRIPESLSTDGEGCRSHAPGWCKVAYWEMSERVGKLCEVKKSSINIFMEDESDACEGISLKELTETKKTTMLKDAENGKLLLVRQKIGLGVTLSQESDGVWLYNRSTMTVFVWSPTLSDLCVGVQRVLPGDCLKAFDSKKAKSLLHRCQYPDLQTGPVNVYSISISFGKCWGPSYKRQNITRCPCWLEVDFSQR